MTESKTQTPTPGDKTAISLEGFADFLEALPDGTTVGEMKEEWKRRTEPEKQPPPGWSADPFEECWNWSMVRESGEIVYPPKSKERCLNDNLRHTHWYAPCRPPDEGDKTLAEQVEAFRKDFDDFYEKTLTPRSETDAMTILTIFDKHFGQSEDNDEN